MLNRKYVSQLDLNVQDFIIENWDYSFEVHKDLSITVVNNNNDEDEREYKNQEELKKDFSDFF